MTTNASLNSLNELGKEGWELITVTVEHGPNMQEEKVFYLKRAFRKDKRQLLNET